jgi:hypothetical protein
MASQSKWQRRLKIKKLKTPPEINSSKHSQYKLSPLDRHYHVSSLNHLVSKEFNQLCAQSLSLFGNELIKHKPREE